jgi:hypothetical protein
MTRRYANTVVKYNQCVEAWTENPNGLRVSQGRKHVDVSPLGCNTVWTVPDTSVAVEHAAFIFGADVCWL